jgi:hypothetical protein
VLLCAVLQTNVLSVAATPKLDYVVGGCMDSCVHIWKFEQPAPKQAKAESEAAAAAGESDEEEEEGVKLIKYSCGGYMTKVGEAVGFGRSFNACIHPGSSSSSSSSN